MPCPRVTQCGPDKQAFGKCDNGTKEVTESSSKEEEFRVQGAKNELKEGGRANAISSGIGRIDDEVKLRPVKENHREHHISISFGKTEKTSIEKQRP